MRVSVKMNWDWEEISGLVYYITLDGGGGAAWGGARLEDDGILQRLGGSHDDGRRGHRVTVNATSHTTYTVANWDTEKHMVAHGTTSSHLGCQYSATAIQKQPQARDKITQIFAQICQFAPKRVPSPPANTRS